MPKAPTGDGVGDDLPRGGSGRTWKKRRQQKGVTKCGL
jgi:hypothetical protein